MRSKYDTIILSFGQEVDMRAQQSPRASTRLAYSIRLEDLGAHETSWEKWCY